MAKTLNKLTIGSIFEKDEQGDYTSDAQLRQDMLRITVQKITPFCLMSHSR
jgi:hypothetical protein